MSADEFKAIQKTLGWTNEKMADVLCCSLRLVEKMRQGDRAVSARTAKMLARLAPTLVPQGQAGRR